MDVAVDMLGSFLSDRNAHAFNKIMDLLLLLIIELFGAEETNFLSLSKILDLDVKRGDKNLDTCF